jgi:hypothetical protein
MPKKSEPTISISFDINAEDTKGARPPCKSVLVQDLLRRGDGASLEELVTATSWQPHSARAFISGLGKRGIEVVREKVSGVTRYRVRAGK